MAFTKKEKDEIKKLQSDYAAAQKKGDQAGMRKAHEAADKIRGYQTTTITKDGKYSQEPTKKLWQNVAREENASHAPLAPMQLNIDTLRQAQRAKEAGTQLKPQATAAKAFVPEITSRRDTFLNRRDEAVEKKLPPININAIPQEKMDSTARQTILSKASKQNAELFRGLNFTDKNNQPTSDMSRIQQMYAPKTERTIPMQGAYNPNDPWNIAMNDPERKKNFVSKNIWKGVSGASNAIMSTLDWILPNELAGKYDVLEPVFNYYRGIDQDNQYKAEAANDTQVKKVTGQLISGTVQALPSAIMALMSAGTSLGGQALGTGITNANKVNTIGTALQAAVKEQGKNPMFWNSFLQMAGPTYESEIANGANELQASASALFNGILGSAIETSGGLETFKWADKGWKKLLTTALEEGGEEISQYGLENLINKAIGSNTAKWASLNPEESAVVNPLAQLEQGAYGAAIGGILGGGQQAFASGVNKANDIRNGEGKIPVIQPDGRVKYENAPTSSVNDSYVFDALGITGDYNDINNISEMNMELYNKVEEAFNIMDEINTNGIDSVSEDKIIKLSGSNDLFKNAIDNRYIVEKSRPYYDQVSREIDKILTRSNTYKVSSKAPIGSVQPQTSDVGIAESMQTETPLENIGKKQGNNVSIHKSYEDSVTRSDITQAKEKAGNPDFDIIRVNQKNGDVSFIKTDDFDGNTEPLITSITTVSKDGNVKTEAPKGKIIVDKGRYVPDDYTGFDVKAARDREEAWRKSGVNYDSTQIDNKEYFEGHLRNVGITEETQDVPGSNENIQDEQISDSKPNEAQSVSTEPEMGKETGKANATLNAPLKVSRIEESDAIDFSKPQGLYTTPTEFDSPHTDISGKTYHFEVSKDAKVYDVEFRGKIQTDRANRPLEAGSTLNYLVDVLGKDAVETLAKLSKNDLIKVLSEDHPNVEWNKYYDNHEMLEGYGGLLARANSVDVVRQYEKDDRFSEVVILNGNVAKEIIETIPETTSTESKDGINDYIGMDEDYDEVETGELNEDDKILDSGVINKDSNSRKSGDVFDTTTYGNVTIIDDSDSSTIKLKLESGSEVTVGRNAFENMINQKKDDSKSVLSQKSEKEPIESSENVIDNEIETVPASLMDELIAIIGEDTIGKGPSQKEMRDTLTDVYHNSDNLDYSYNVLIKSIRNLTITEKISNDISDLLRTIRNTKIKISDDMRNSIPDFNDFRKRNLAYIRLANEGSNIDTFYEELVELYPEYFSDEVTHPADQLELIADTVKRLSIDGKKTYKISDVLSEADIASMYILPILETVHEYKKGGNASELQAEGTTKRDGSTEETQRGINESDTEGRGKKKSGGEEVQSVPKQVIADAIIEKLDSNTKFSSQELFNIADKAFNGSQAQGVYDVKTAYDSMELGINQYLINNAEKFRADTPQQAIENIGKLEDLISLLPTQGSKRNEKMEQYQQFSTPPTIAYVADYVANVKNNDVVLEPSAGVGGLVALPKGWGARVYVNELEEGRFDTIQKMPFDGFFNENAEQINNILPDDIKPTLVIMNPPFSTSAERFGNKRNTNFATRHIEQALLRLEDNGRLVAIVGRGMSEDAATFKDWWTEIKGKYDVKANIRIDGSNYKKYGTTFDIQMLVIDKDGLTSTETLTGEYADLSDALNALEGIRNERREFNKAPEHEATVTDSKVAAGKPGRDGPVLGTGAKESDVDISDNNKQPRPNTEISDIEGGGRVVADTPNQETIRDNDGINRGTEDGGKAQRDGEQRGQIETADDIGGRESGRKPIEQLETVNKKSTSNDIIETDDDVYNVYKSKKLRIKGAKAHPTDLVESAAMSAIDAPAIAYVPVLDKNLIENGVLSDAQLEVVSYAGQIHQKKLPDGKRQGYFIGDGTGVGKGREISGIILDNYNQGRTKAIWVSKNFDLFKDAVRDLTALGYPREKIHNASKYKAEDDLSKLDGVLFIGYDTLKGASRNNPSKTRLKQAEGFFGKDYDGPLLFDESHNMGSATDSGEGLNKKKASGKALAGVEIQEILHNARVVYASATGATEVDNLAYLTRLGLWGENTPFENVSEFVSKIGAGGLAAMELVARDMKALGVYNARNLSFKGVEYDTLTHDLTPMQESIYGEMCKAWQVVFQDVESALDYTGANGNSRAKMRAKGQFYSSLQRFYNQVITSMSVPSVIGDIKKELANGHSAVIQLVNTNEAAANRSITKAQEEGMSLDDIDMTPSEMLVGYLNTSFPIYEYEEYEDDKGNKRSRLVTDRDGKPVINKEAVKKRDALIEHVKQLKVPEGPLEMIINEFGSDAVAEITGRKRRVVEKNGKKGIEKLTEKTKDADEKAFQSGKKRILIFSDAGGTGKSYHASRDVENQQRRIHYLLQPGWNASNATQGFGRTHRSNQAVAPIFRLVTTNVAGQKRFTSTIAKRLDQLGALTKGQRDTGSGIFSAKDNLENTIAKDALQQFYRKLARNTHGLNGESIFRKLGLYNNLFDEYGTYRENPTVVRDTSKFLNRILALEVQEQNKVFEIFSDTIDEVFNRELAAGTVDMGTENHISDKIEIAEEITIRTDENTGAETKYMKIVSSNKPTIIDFDSLPALHSNFVGLVKMKDSDEVRAVYKTANKTLSSGEVTNAYRLISPVKEGSDSNYIQATFDERTESIPKKEWKKQWDNQISKSPEYVDETMYMLTGVLLPVWNRLPETVTRVRRVMDKDGTIQILGRIIPANQIDGVLQRFDTHRTKEIYTAEQLYEKVMSGNDVVLRDSKQRIVRRRVSGENRIEIIGDNIWFYGTFPGVFNERINSQYRYFVPTDIDKARPVLDRIVQNNPVVEVSKGAKVSGDDIQYSKVKPAPKLAGQNFAGQIYQPTQQQGSRVEAILASIPKKYKTKNPNQIKGDVVRYFTVNIHSKNFRRPSGTLAYFKPKHAVISTRHTQAIGPIAHELGHKLDRNYGFVKTGKLKKIWQDAPGYSTEMELRGYKDDQKSAEVLADFVMMYLTNPDAAYELGGYYSDTQNFYDVFESTLKEKDLKNIRNLQRDVLMWGAQDRIDKVLGTIGHRANKKPPTFKQGADTFMRSFIDGFDGAKQFTDAVAKGSGASIEETNNTYEMLRKTLSAPSITSAILTERLINPEGFEAGESFGSILKGVKNNHMHLFDAYLKEKHSLDWMARDMRVYSIEMDSEQEIRASIAKLEREHPEFIQTSENLYSWWKDFTKMWLVDTGVMTQELYDTFNELYPHYVPNFRQTDGIKGKDGKVVGDPLKRASGKSDLPTYSATENMIYQIGSIVKAGTRNQALSTLHTLYNNPEYSETVGLFLDQIPPDMTRHNYNAVDLKRALENEFFKESWDKLSDSEKAAFESAPMKEQLRMAGEMSNTEIIDQIVSDSITYFTAKEKSSDPNTVVAMVNGKAKFYHITDENLAMAFMAMMPKQMGGIARMVKALTRGFTGLTTANNPLFAIANHVRDIQHGIVMADSNYHALDPRTYLSYFKDLLVTYGQIASHNKLARKLGVKESEMYALYRANAGMDSKFMPRGDQYNRTMREIHGWRARHRSKAGNVVSTTQNVLASAVDIISDFNGAIEAAPRMIAFNRAYKEGGKTPDALIKAVHASKEASVDFWRRGTAINTAATAVPFIGASIAGIDQFRRITMTKEAWTTKEGRQRLLRAMISQALPAILIALLYDGDDDYEDLNEYIKDGYWLIKYDDEKFVRLPKEREISAVFGTSFQRATRLYLQPDLNKQEEVESYFKYALSTFVPAHEIIGTAIFDAINNKTWHGGQIVPRREEDLMRPGHYNEIHDDTTSIIAVWLAKVLPDIEALGALNTPRGLEYALDQLSGGIGDVIFPATTPTSSGVADSLLRRYMTDSVYSNKYSNEAYETLADLTADVASAKRAGIEVDEKTAAWQKAFSNTLSGQSNKFTTVSNYYAEIRNNNNNPTLTREEREEANRGIRKEINRITKELVTAYKEGGKPKYSYADVVMDEEAEAIGITESLYAEIVNNTNGKTPVEQKYILATSSGLTAEQKEYVSESLLNNKSYDEWGPAYETASASMSIGELVALDDILKPVIEEGSDKYINSKGNEVSIGAGDKRDGTSAGKSASRKKKEAIDAANPNADKNTLEALYTIYNVSKKVW